MALANLIKPNTYSVVSILGYDKHRKNVSFVVHVYEDSSKETLLTTLKYSLSRFNSITVKSRTVADADDVVNPQANDMYLVPQNAVNLWGWWKGSIVYWDTNFNSWQLYTKYAEGDHVEVEDEGVWLVKDEGQWFDVSIPNKASNWTNYFDSALFEAEGMDLMKGIYLYLKNERPEFANTIDA
jgi:hypothetical protein